MASVLAVEAAPADEKREYSDHGGFAFRKSTQRFFQAEMVRGPKTYTNSRGSSPRSCRPTAAAFGKIELHDSDHKRSAAKFSALRLGVYGPIEKKLRDWKECIALDSPMTCFHSLLPIACHKMRPIDFEHIGSFKRPQHLIDARARFDNGEISKSQLETIEQGEIRHIVVMQQKLGFKAITDGEYPRHMFFEGFFTNLEGMTYVKDPDPNIFMDYIPDVAPYKAAGFKGAETYLCTGKIKRTKPCYVPWFTALAKEVEPEDVKYVKMTICAPEWYHLRHSSKYAYTPEAYTNDTDYFADIAKAYREELDALYDAGCRNIQIDEPLFSFFCSAAMREGMKEVGVDAEALLDTYIKLYHDCLRTRKPDMFVGMHVCRGNFKGSVHFVEGGYDPIAEKVFRMPDIDCFYLEYDTPRAGSFEPLRHLPKDKSVVLGLISSKFPDMESKSDILARLDEAAEIMGDPGKERICLSPQCGFASHIEGNKVTETDVEKKLALVVEIAKAVWGTSEWRHQCAFCKNQSPLAMAMYCGQ